MKNLYLIFLFFFLMDSSLVAQIEVEYVFSELPLLKMNKTAFLQEKLITVGSSHTCLQGTLFSLEDDQQDLVRGPEGYYFFSEVVTHPDLDSLVLVYGFFALADDVVSPEDGPRIFVYDDSLQLLRMIKVETPWMYFDQGDLEITGDQELALTFSDTLYFYSVAGEQLEKQNYSENDLLGIQNRGDTSLLVFEKNYLRVLDNRGEELNQLPIAENIIGIASQADQIFLLTETNLLVVKDNSIIAQTEIIHTNLEPKGITSYDGFVYCYGSKMTGDAIVRLPVSDLSSIEEISIPDPEIAIKSLLVNDQGLLINAYYHLDDFPYTYDFVKSTPVFNDFQFDNNDIALLNFRFLDTLELGIDPYAPDTIYTFSGRDVRYEIEVENNTDEDLTSFSIVSNSWWSINCAMAYFFDHFSNIHIPPGQTAVLIDSFPSVYFLSSEPNSDGLPTIKMRAYGPNHQLDLNQDNNTVIMDFLVSSRNIEATDFSITLFPNPTTGQLALSFDLDKTVDNSILRIYDQLGQLQHQQVLSTHLGPNSHTLDLHHLPAGIYYLQLSSGTHQRVEKIVIQPD